MTDVVPVVAAVIRGREGKILISRRPAHLHQGNKWEFPGGKIEAGETPEAALARELKEELGITPVVSRPLIQITHHYPDKSVHLDVREVIAFSGQPHGREGQGVEWVDAQSLSRYEFPAANAPIVKAATLPTTWLVTPEPADYEPEAFFEALDASLEAGAGGVILRTRELSLEDAQSLLDEVAVVCDEFEVPLAFNGERGVRLPKGVIRHLSSDRLDEGGQADERWSVSCHTTEDLQRAGEAGAEFALLSPVLATESHPGQEPLGWERFAECVRPAILPVYALGGVAAPDAMQARRCGGQGVAGIRGFWQAGS